MCVIFAGCGYNSTKSAQSRLEKAIKIISTSTQEEDKFYALNDAAKQSFIVGKTQDASKYATELLNLANRFKTDWNYGNAIQDANLVLGRIALKEGRTEEAKSFLLASGRNNGSPQLETFGPNMSLAQDLLEKGESTTVLQYLELCHKFWKMEEGKLDRWTKQIKKGKKPNFGTNLLY